MKKLSIHLILLVAAGVIALSPLAAFADTVNVAEDAYTKADKPDENKGSDKKVEVKDEVNDKDRIGYAKFDLSTLPGGVVAADIVKATLRMWMEKVDSAGTIEIVRVDEDWDEHTITANLSPLLGLVVATPSIGRRGQGSLRHGRHYRPV